VCVCGVCGVIFCLLLFFAFLEILYDVCYIEVHIPIYY
jgi:hypothetical protein